MKLAVWNLRTPSWREIWQGDYPKHIQSQTNGPQRLTADHVFKTHLTSHLPNISKHTLWIFFFGGGGIYWGSAIIFFFSSSFFAKLKFKKSLARLRALHPASLSRGPGGVTWQHLSAVASCFPWHNIASPENHGVFPSKAQPHRAAKPLQKRLVKVLSKTKGVWNVRNAQNQRGLWFSYPRSSKGLPRSFKELHNTAPCPQKHKFSQSHLMPMRKPPHVEAVEAHHEKYPAEMILQVHIVHLE